MSNETKIVKGKIAFDTKDELSNSYRIIATYLKKPKADALIEIKKNNKIIKEFLFPGYKVWNIAAHADDIIDGLEEESDEGLYVAGSDGLGGNAYNGDK